MFSNQSMQQDKYLKSIKRKLMDLDPRLSFEYLNWLDKKTTYFRQSILKASYGPQPDNIQRGDIVWVELGVNVGSELSDLSTKGHYALVWAIDLGNVIVIPLTSRPSLTSPLTLELGVIEGLNGENNNISYLKLDAIRSISKRRIGRMSNKENGKITLDKEIIDLIKKHIQKYLIEDYQVNSYNEELEILNYIAEDLYQSDYKQNSL